ncbi:UDP-N-acetylglucosamine 2-epimerase (hydrolyzing) [Trinickia violacea]|uniref:UDP-N-acetylglucosamine 2-epimerase (Hydrolyzing) n=1 Tax=Trinickia violacea TaxID=2571746 RepID=A0A4P8J0Q5_9BURK|nr:UDP-N-acetylglucosamine 2-epimerase [Trinickia violacea]QCP53483.1 UDP-N-acetylglucosamine 2-epimerase (hydrolyzing) [Trinickia violacea]
MRTICIFTGTRAEYGLLRPLIRALAATQDVTVKLLATGSHVAESSGATWREIAGDGIAIDERIEVLMDSASESGVYTAMGLGMIRYGDAFRRLEPDLLVILGDRFEAFAAAAAATVCKIPIAHLHGGELTFGAIDESFRHAITKLSHLHFASTEAYRTRVIQLGERPDRVFAVGAMGVENIRTLDLFDKDEIDRRLGIDPQQPYFLVTFHPATLSPKRPEAQLNALLDALERFPDHTVVMTGANADAGGMAINRLLAARAAEHPGRYRFHMSLGARLYLSAARYAAAVVGNSSSAIIEVPTLGVPSVDIGPRQAGRVRGESVITCDDDTAHIVEALRRALSADFRQRAASASNPYDRPGTTAQIVDILVSHDLSDLLHKTFYDLH